MSVRRLPTFTCPACLATGMDNPPVMVWTRVSGGAGKPPSPDFEARCSRQRCGYVERYAGAALVRIALEDSRRRREAR